MGFEHYRSTTQHPTRFVQYSKSDYWLLGPPIGFNELFVILVESELSFTLNHAWDLDTE